MLPFPLTLTLSLNGRGDAASSLVETSGYLRPTGVKKGVSASGGFRLHLV